MDLSCENLLKTAEKRYPLDDSATCFVSMLNDIGWIGPKLATLLQSLDSQELVEKFSIKLLDKYEQADTEGGSKLKDRDFWELVIPKMIKVLGAKYIGYDCSDKGFVSSSNNPGSRNSTPSSSKSNTSASSSRRSVSRTPGSFKDTPLSNPSPPKKVPRKPHKPSRKKLTFRPSSAAATRDAFLSQSVREVVETEHESDFATMVVDDDESKKNEFIQWIKDKYNETIRPAAWDMQLTHEPEPMGEKNSTWAADKQDISNRLKCRKGKIRSAILEIAKRELYEFEAQVPVCSVINDYGNEIENGEHNKVTYGYWEKPKKDTEETAYVPYIVEVQVVGLSQKEGLEQWALAFLRSRGQVPTDFVFPHGPSGLKFSLHHARCCWGESAKCVELQINNLWPILPGDRIKVKDTKPSITKNAHIQRKEAESCNVNTQSLELLRKARFFYKKKTKEQKAASKKVSDSTVVLHTDLSDGRSVGNSSTDLTEERHTGESTDSNDDSSAVNTMDDENIVQSSAADSTNRISNDEVEEQEEDCYAEPVRTSSPFTLKDFSFAESAALHVPHVIVKSFSSKRRTEREIRATQEEEQLDRINTEGYEEANFRVVISNGKGKGVITKQNLVGAQLIMEYKGDFIDAAEGYRREKEEYPEPANCNKMFYFHYNDEVGRRSDYCIDAMSDAYEGTYGRLLNHTLSNNNVDLNFLLKTTNDDGNTIIRAFFKTNRPIKAGTELCWDYGIRDKTSLHDNPFLKSRTPPKKFAVVVKNIPVLEAVTRERDDQQGCLYRPMECGTIPHQNTNIPETFCAKIKSWSSLQHGLVLEMEMNNCELNVQIRHPFWYGAAPGVSVRDAVDQWAFLQNKLFNHYKDNLLNVTVVNRSTIPVLVEIDVPCVDATFTNLLSDQAFYMASDQNGSMCGEAVWSVLQAAEFEGATMSKPKLKTSKLRKFLRDMKVEISSHLFDKGNVQLLVTTTAQYLVGYGFFKLPRNQKKPLRNIKKQDLLETWTLLRTP